MKIETIIYGTKSMSFENEIFVKEEDFEIPHGEDYKIAVKFLEQILENNPDFLENFRYENLSLWWFLYQSLIPKLKKTLNFIVKFSEMVDELKPNTVIIEDDFSKFNLIQQICIEKNVIFSYSKKSFSKYSLFNKSKSLIQKNRYAKIFNQKTLQRKKIFSEKNKIIPNISNKYVFAIPTNYRRSIYDVIKSQSVEGEYIQHSIFNLLKNKNIIGIDLDYTFRGDFNILSNRLEDDFPWFPIESIISKNHNSEKIKNFLSVYKQLINSKNFQKLFIFKNISFWKNIEQFFVEMLYAPNFPFYLQLIESLKLFFKNHKPKCIFLPYETGPFALAIISICKNFQIKTIGIQHGYIYKNNPMYVFGKFTTEKQKLGFPIPDYTLLFGNYVKNLLEEDGYPSKNLIVFGNPAFFNFSDLITNFDLSKIKSKLDIKKSPQIILFTTGKLQRNYSEHGKYDYDEQIWNSLLSNFGSNPKYHLILKPHPQEKNTTVYSDMIKKLNSTNAIISNESIYELINLSSVVISVFSSTMFDSIVFKKPVIRVKFQNEHHPIFDQTDGIFTSSMNELFKNILKILDSNDVKESLISKSQILLKEHYGIPEQDPQEILNQLIHS